MSFRDDLAAAADWVAEFLETIRERPVGTDVLPGETRAALPASPPERGEPLAELLADFDRLVAPGLVHWNHPRFFAYFANTGSEPGILAELLAAAVNVNAMVWSSSPAATEVEQLACDWLGQLLGLPGEWHGHIEDTASISTVAALAAARGPRPGGVVYASEHANFSNERAARLVGLEYRKVPVDGGHRLRPELVDFDAATAVIATVGTTATTAVDPVPALAEGCAASGAWLHVDGAYAAAAAVCPEFRWALEGCDRADSLVVNAHKWLATPMDCSILYTARPDALHAAFALVPDYLPESERALDLKDYGPALGRRFRGLKLWAVLRGYGREGLQEMIRRHCRLAREFASWVEAEPGWEVVAPVPFSTVCFRRSGADNEALLARANATREVYLSGTRLDGEFALRLAIGNARTEEQDVRAAWDVLRRASN